MNFNELFAMDHGDGWLVLASLAISAWVIVVVATVQS